MIGEKIGRLTITSKASSRKVECECECGVKKTIRIDHIRAGRTVSCGCYRIEKTAELAKTHGLSKTRTYRIWRCMINRCHYEAYPERYLYGGRGISVCTEWRNSFDNFYADMGEAPNGLSIDRIDGDGNYEKSNCKWSTPKEQANNRRPRHKK